MEPRVTRARKQLLAWQSNLRYKISSSFHSRSASMPEKSPQGPEKTAKFAPGERRARLRGWRRWLPFRPVPGIEGHHWQLSWRRLAAWLGVLAVAAYLSLALGA
jgi:hypothetical protein